MLPVGHRAPLGREHGVAVVVAPATPAVTAGGDVEELPGEPLVDEPQAADQTGRADVARLDVGLDAVQAHPDRLVGERESDHQREALGEEAPPGVGVVGVVADGGALECAAYDVADVDAAHEPVVPLRVECVDHERPVGR